MIMGVTGVVDVVNVSVKYQGNRLPKKFSDWKNWKSQTAQFLLVARLFSCEAVLTPHFIKGVWLAYTHICMCAVLESVNSAILRKVKTMMFKEFDFWKNNLFLNKFNP